jgi:hypothetical protein
LVGGSTLGTVGANEVVTGVLDGCLAKTGFDSQQTNQPRDPDQPVNLWEPADQERDFGTHGVFDSKSTDRSVQLWASQHHGLLAAATAAGVALVGAGAAALRSR